MSKPGTILMFTKEEKEYIAKRDREMTETWRQLRNRVILACFGVKPTTPAPVHEQGRKDTNTP